MKISQLIRSNPNKTVLNNIKGILPQNFLKVVFELLGLTDVVGEGIVIQLIDNEGKKLSEDATVYRINQENIRRLINDLFAAGAEAISINGNRIISTSSIYTVGSNIIKVNGKKISSPYVINAIGNSEYLKSSVTGKGGSVDWVKELGHETSVDISKEIIIEKYEEEISSKYIKEREKK